MEGIGNRLKLLRERHGLSQMELSHKSGISQASIARIETGQQQNLKTETIEKLAAALEIPLSHLLEEPLMISENVSQYRMARMIPVITLQKFVASGGRAGIKDSHERFETSLSSDPLALFITSCGSLDSNVESDDLLLVEPSSQINNGDTVLFISKGMHCIGKIYYHPSTCIIQPLDSAAEPVFFSPKMRKNRNIKLFRVAEIRRTF
jgi:transcriptional regulator with XRE-family HTH domain